MSNHQRVKILFLVIAAVVVVMMTFYAWPGWILLLIVALYLGIVSLGVFNLSFGFFLPVKYRGGTSDRKIALTFDDGPLPHKTEQILSILKRFGAPATFFCIGSRVAQHPEIVEKINAEGHLVGNHTFSHSKTIDLYPTSRICRELLDTDEVIAEVLQRKPRFFRPPFGVTNPMIANATKKGKYVVVGWSLRSFDTIIKDPDKLFKRAARSLKSGDIVLFHDYSDSMIAMLPDFLELVKQKGLAIVPLDHLLNEKPYR